MRSPARLGAFPDVARMGGNVPAVLVCDCQATGESAESGMQLCRDLPAYGFLLHVAASLYFFAFPLAATQAYTKASGIAITKSNNVLPLFFELYVTTNNGEPVHFRIRHFLCFNVPGRLSSFASSGQSAPYPQKSIAPTRASLENLCPPAYLVLSHPAHRAVRSIRARSARP